MPAPARRLAQVVAQVDAPVVAVAFQFRPWCRNALTARRRSKCLASRCHRVRRWAFALKGFLSSRLEGRHQTNVPEARPSQAAVVVLVLGYGFSKLVAVPT
jgi:hypothetical protein